MNVKTTKKREIILQNKFKSNFVDASLKCGGYCQYAV